MDTYIAPKVIALTDASTIVVDASLGNDFTVTLGGSRTMGIPSNPHNGQKIEFELTQDGTGSRLITWASGSGGYTFGGSSAPTLNATAAASDVVAFRYSSGAGRWQYLGIRP
jgi:hypothetical protein